MKRATAICLRYTRMEKKKIIAHSYTLTIAATLTYLCCTRHSRNLLVVYNIRLDLMHVGWSDLAFGRITKKGRYVTA